ncbi:hypothetical protein ACF05T_31945 [Streptomyces lateritius]|uniref:Enoyl reductase FAD binding domain-containing protein n=1 Tax=Streptomyces lateritius TaxID=67313 RepID=A0ABW6YL76_9ACTN
MRGVLGEDLVPPIRQLAALWDQLTGAAPLALDDDGHIRLDTFELTDDVQAAIAEHWETATTATIAAWPISTGSTLRSDASTDSPCPASTTQCRPPRRSLAPPHPLTRVRRNARGKALVRNSPLIRSVPVAQRPHPAGQVRELE